MKLVDVDYLKIRTIDKHEFVISNNAILLCPGLIKLVEDATEAQNRMVEITISNATRPVMRTVLDYLYYKMRFLSVGAAQYEKLPPFKVAPNLSLEVFKLANQLGI